MELNLSTHLRFVPINQISSLVSQESDVRGLQFVVTPRSIFCYIYVYLESGARMTVSCVNVGPHDMRCFSQVP